MEIRKATKNDLQTIGILYRQFFKTMASYRPDFLQEADQDKEFLKKVIDATDYDLILACEGDLIKGFVLLSEVATPPYNCFVQKKIGYLMDIYVIPESQGQGIGTMLLNEAKRWTKGRALDYLELNVLHENKLAAKLYEHEGFEKTLVTMGIKP